MEYGNKLSPEHSLRTARMIKGMREKIIITHNPNEVDQNQLLLVRFPDLGSDNVTIPGMANLSFNFKLDSTDDKDKMLDRLIFKKLAVKFGGNEILSMDDFDVFACYRQLWNQLRKRRTQ